MVFSIDRTKFKTETGKQLYDLLTKIYGLMMILLSEFYQRSKGMKNVNG